MMRVDLQWATRLTATVNRNIRGQQNVSNAVSFLQVQDGALSTVGKILDRMSELKTMSLDVTKNSLDIANYDAEFSQLQQQLSNVRDEKFNGISLFSTTGNDSLTVTTEKGDEGDVEVVKLGGIADRIVPVGRHQQESTEVGGLPTA